MGKKQQRLEVVKMIVSTQELSKQEELIAELEKRGYPTAQATMSRCLNALGIVKAQNAEGRYVYMLPQNDKYVNVSTQEVTVSAINRMGALGVRFSGNMAVIRTLAGHAMHVAMDIDAAQLPFVVGTVAGHDTVFVVMEEDTDRAQALDAFSQVVPAHFRA
jgi:transcriptional regulator of arginine metabolism